MWRLYFGVFGVIFCVRVVRGAAAGHRIGAGRSLQPLRRDLEGGLNPARPLLRVRLQCIRCHNIYPLDLSIHNSLITQGGPGGARFLTGDWSWTEQFGSTGDDILKAMAMAGAVGFWG